MRDNQLRCDCCNRLFDAVVQHKSFVWEYDENGMERIFCVTCTKKNAQRSSNMERFKRSLPVRPPQIIVKVA